DSAARPPNWTDKSSVFRRGGNAAPRPVAGEPTSIEGCARTLGGEGTGGWEVCLVLRYRLEKVEAAAFNLVQELAEERLVIGLAQRFVALREVVTFLHFEALERLDQLVGVVAAVELRRDHGDLYGVHGLVVRLHVAIGQWPRRVDLGQSCFGFIEEPVQIG